MCISTSFQRLPKTIIPSAYELEVKTDTETEIFSGSVNINVTIRSPVSEIFLHSVDLNIETAKVVKDSKDYPATIQMVPEMEGIILRLDDKLTEGQATIFITYGGKLNQNMKGYYTTCYKNNDELIKCAATQFEPADARRALPCFDEPDLKAVFTVTLIARTDQTVLSNMQVDSSEPLTGENGLVITRFKPSPIMSTYLLAFIVGKYDYVEGFDKNGVRVRIYTSLGRSNEGEIALNIAIKALEFYAEFFDYPYVIPKCDMIALADFAMGAMENWGLITYRETALLATETSSMAIKQRVAEVVGHELAHMWFGNLVTMDWWTYLWLNEGFATWISYLCVDHVFPEYDIWTQFQINEISVAMALDSLETSHPVEVSVGPPSEVEEIFDRISYSKGSSVIGYLYHFLGGESFRNGLRKYLKTHAFANTKTEDLWASLEEASGVDVSGIMNNFVTCKGFPYLTVSRPNSTQIIIQQNMCSKFSDDSTIWQIPFNMVTQSSPNTPVKLFLRDRESVYDIKVGEDEWIKLNYGNNGFYRVKYTGDLRNLIIGAAESVDNLDKRDKIGLLNDFSSLANIGEMSLVDCLKLCWSLRNETDYNIWRSILDIISTVNTFMQMTESFSKFSTFVGRLIGNVYKFVGWTPVSNEDSSISLLRSLVFSIMVKFGNDEFDKKCLSLFRKIEMGSPVHADLQSSVYRNVMLKGPNEMDTLDKLIKYYSESNLSEERMRILTSLGYSQNPQIIQKIIEFSETDAVRSQDYPFVMVGLSAIKSNTPVVWNYFKDNYATLSKRLTAFGLISRIVKSVTSNFDTQECIDDMENFFGSVDVGVIGRCVKQSIELAKVRKCLCDDNYNDVVGYLNTMN